jgi:hypothetical protein
VIPCDFCGVLKPSDSRCLACGAPNIDGCMICGEPLTPAGLCPHCDRPAHTAESCQICRRIADGLARTAGILSHTPPPSPDQLADVGPCPSCGLRLCPDPDGTWWCPNAACAWPTTQPADG